MNDPAPEPSIAQLSAKIDDAILGLKWMFSLLILLVAIPNILLSLSIDHFAQIFADALPGKPLPLLTVAIIHTSIFLRILALAWPVLGILSIVYGTRVRNWIIVSTVAFFLIALQMSLTWLACFIPMGGLITGMSDTVGK